MVPTHLLNRVIETDRLQPKKSLKFEGWGIREISIDYSSVGFNSGRVVEIGRLSVNTHLDLPTVSHLVSIQCSGREILSGSKVVLSP